MTAALALAACGGDDGSSDGNGSVADNGSATEGSADGAAKGEGSADSKQGGSGKGKADGGEGSAGSQSDRSSTPGANGGSGSGSGDGGSDGEGGSSQPDESADRASRAAFIGRVSAICTRGQREGLAKLGNYLQRQAKGSGGQDPATMEKGIQATLLPAVRKQIAEIRALGAPAGDGGEIEAFLAALEDDVEASAKKGGSPSGEALEANFKRSAELARAYGLEACAYGSVG